MPDPSAFPGSDVRQLIKLSQPGMILVFSPESCSHPISLHFSDPIAIPLQFPKPGYLPVTKRLFRPRAAKLVWSYGREATGVLTVDGETC